MTISESYDVLSERELEVLKLVATGATNQQIARDLFISPNTVKVHLRNIFEKLGVQSRTEATMEAVRRGWVDVPGEAEAVAPALAPADAAGPAVSEAAAAPAPGLPPISLPELMPHAPARPSVAPWQRGLLITLLLLTVLGAAAPSWLSSRSAAATLTAFTDVGRPQVEPPGRVSAQRWTGGAPMPERRSRLALASDGQRIYAIGGETADGVTGEVEIYDPTTNGWLPGAGKPTPVANIAAGVLDGLVYVLGGSTANGGVTDVVEIYDPAADAWTSGPALPRPLAGYALAVWNGKLYVFGGWDGSSYRREALIFDPATSTWAQGPAMPGPRAFAGAAALNDTIYVAGGTNGRSNLADLLAFDPKADPTSGPGAGSAWQAKAPMKEPRAGLGVVSVGSQLFALGGSRDTGDTFNEQYDARLDAWSRLGTPVPGAWRNLAAAPLKNKVHVVGGWSGAYIDVHEQYAALVQLLIPLTGSG